MTSRNRPFGVTVLAILWILEALGAFGVAAIIGTLTAYLETMIGGAIGTEFITTIGSAVTVVAVIFGIIYLLIAYGLWTGQGWAWILSVIFAILGVIGGIIGLIGIVGIVPLVINIIILYYLYRPHVKAFFGKGPAPEAPPAPPPS